MKEYNQSPRFIELSDVLKYHYQNGRKVFSITQCWMINQERASIYANREPPYEQTPELEKIIQKTLKIIE